MAEPDAATCRAALQILLHWMPPEQRAHAYLFLLRDWEAIYIAAGCPPPSIINILRSSPSEPDS